MYLGGHEMPSISCPVAAPWTRPGPNCARDDDGAPLPWMHCRRKHEQIPPPASKLSPQGRQTLERKKQEAMRLRDMSKVAKENTLSPYRYVTSTERYSIFGSLVKASSLSRSIHSQGVTLLCPKNEAFESDLNWESLLLEANGDALDAWVSRHVIPVAMRYERFKTQKEHLDLNNNPIKMETRGGIKANGARVRSGDVVTKMAPSSAWTTCWLT